METEFQATSQLYWIAALIAALIDIAFVALLAWRIKLARFRRLKWPLVIAAGAFWLSLWSWAMWDPFVWETCYQYVFPAWVRPFWPFAFCLMNGGLALLFWWLARRIPGNPVLYFLLLGGLESFGDHYFAIRKGVMETPLLQEVSIASAVTFGFFEFIFYWSVILGLATLLPLVWDRWQASKKEKGNSL
jgi:hypothetical protein